MPFPPPAHAARTSRAVAIVRVTSGNFLEMFDFFLFGFFAKPIGDAFFPVEDDVGRLLLTFMTFGAGFLMRPLGAVVLGAYVDRVGRRKGLILTLAIMALGTVLIAITPGFRTFAAVSPSLAYAAPLLVLFGRLAQGFSAGVELGGVSVYLAELAPPGRRGFYASWQSGSQQVAIMVAALLGFALGAWLLPAQIAAWGWRLPFAVGCLIVPLLFVIRRRLEETEAFLVRRERPDTRTVLRTLAENWRIVGLGMMLVAFTTVSFYLITIYTPTFGRQVLKLSAADALVVTFAVGLSNFCWLPVMGAASDRIGRKPILLASTALAIVSTYPALAWLASGPTFGRMLARRAMAVVPLRQLQRSHDRGIDGDCAGQRAHRRLRARLQPRHGIVRRLHAGDLGRAHRDDSRQGGARFLDDGRRGRQSGGGADRLPDAV